MHSIAARIAVCLIIVVATAPAGAASLETMLMPGDLIQGHEKFEQNCKNCHESFSKASQSRRCLECHDHENIATDIREGRGFHGRAIKGDDVNCKRCHTDHKGREADIIHFDAQTFNHALTDFELKGAHMTAGCATCHTKGKKYHQAATKCSICHKEDNPHKQELGEACADCHNEKSWIRTSAFDHDKTKFPLKGKHKETMCSACHPNERYRNIAKACASCHRLNDVHKARYGEKCQDCHSEKKWSEIRFNHDSDTKYRLDGRHKDTPCDGCHKGVLHKDKTGNQCIDCHRNDDAHKGQYGKKCAACHAPSGWKKSSFDHDKDTKFRLSGKHRDVPCNHCHGGDVYRDKLETTCVGCHRKDDVHKEQQGRQCERCHNVRSWSDKIVFDHDVTHFPLIGRHAVASCEECHLTASFKDTKSTCNACHERNDDHKGKLGAQCGQCHNPNSWRLWSFDHDVRTEFKLDGKHAKLNCHACHATRVKSKVELPKDCGSCHLRDDIHSGGFGPRCERCHDTEAFSHIIIRK